MDAEAGIKTWSLKFRMEMAALVPQVFPSDAENAENFKHITTRNSVEDSV